MRTQNKRGESTIIANLIIFVAVMGMAAATVFVFKTLIDDSTNAAASENKRTVEVLKTDFTIAAASYDGAGTVYVYVKNTGKAAFDPDDMDIYIDDMRVPRNASNRTVGVTVDTDTLNFGTWDEAEELEFNVFLTYSVPETHSVAVWAPNGIKAEGEFAS